ncbi:lipoprotein insertase outer membrane protein LolB [Variovorax sp. PCZ-1]|uniref:lipoprotein insertase outer membrane protein LolB n=1 Tax=Variovorax sp. PCZ-1 TaxID=2835533 RepID=UPI001BCB6122|nr:lipoprotein insertase outer membrane protein LolB [Variovorax sp. PCZ-1]MBS7807843.1 outer membrane lipoprotein LolB [Variovorax sp. PCZ-1]
MKRRFFAASGLVFTIISIAGCATNTPANGLKDSKNTAATDSQSYSGRLSLVIEPTATSNELQQSFSGSFELRGNANIGELDLLTPLGQIVMQLRWQPDNAMIIRGSQRQLFANAQDLIQQATGASLSLEQLFAWLQGKDAPVSSGEWQVDLSAHANGRIMARRATPTPAVLRIALEKP